MTLPLHATTREADPAPADLFHLHPQLQTDTFWVHGMELCDLLLMNDRRYPWVILVPRQANARELTDLDPGTRHKLMDEIALVSTAMDRLFQAAKINVAALGNIVPQLHVHVIARMTDDAAWPNPVWGAKAEPYSQDAAESTLQALRAVLGQPAQVSA